MLIGRLHPSRRNPFNRPVRQVDEGDVGPVKRLEVVRVNDRPLRPEWMVSRGEKFTNTRVGDSLPNPPPDELRALEEPVAATVPCRFAATTGVLVSM
jgi:hypothetical protein